MANSIRTPRQGVTAGSRRIAEAVDDEAWQKFRLSLKGKTTTVKLRMLRNYYDDTTHDNRHIADVAVDLDCDVCIRVYNYLKALARGGQLYGGVTLKQALACDWKLDIKKD